MTGEEIHESKEAWRYGLKLMDVLKQKTMEMEKKTGQRWSLVQTPAESTAYRFARLDMKFNGKTAVQ